MTTLLRYGVLVEHDSEGYTAWAPVMVGAYGYGPTAAAAMQHLAENIQALLPDEPDGLVELDQSRELLSVQAHLLYVDDEQVPTVREQELASLSDIAKRLGVTRQTVWNWTQRNEDFPVPLAQTGSGPFWAINEVERWAQQRKRKAG